MTSMVNGCRLKYFEFIADSAIPTYCGIWDKHERCSIADGLTEPVSNASWRPDKAGIRSCLHELSVEQDPMLDYPDRPIRTSPMIAPLARPTTSAISTNNAVNDDDNQI